MLFHSVSLFQIFREIARFRKAVLCKITSIDGKNSFADFAQNINDLTKKIKLFAKLFIPLDVAKVL